MWDSEAAETSHSLRKLVQIENGRREQKKTKQETKEKTRNRNSSLKKNNPFKKQKKKEFKISQRNEK